MENNTLSSEVLCLVESMYDNEATDARLYAELAKRTKSEHNRALLEKMTRDEEKHCSLWGRYLQRPPRVNKPKVWLFSMLARIFGLVFVINLMESGEDKAVATYTKMGETLPVALEVLADEQQHEDHLIAMLKEERLSYISSMVLGLNDALVELTGALAGFTLALNDNTMIGLAGFITGVAATLSMAASEYLAKKADPHENHPLKAATYTGFAYLVTVVLLLTPYALTTQPLLALGFCLFNATLRYRGVHLFRLCGAKAIILAWFQGNDAHQFQCSSYFLPYRLGSPALA